MKRNNNRNHGLDSLRSIAIILVFMMHYLSMTGQAAFGFLSYDGWAGVELFFVLSGYLISNKIFSALRNQRFSLKSFYFRRFLRTLPNYIFVLGLYYLIPEFSEKPLLTPLWKLLTFTQNFDLSFSGFSHAWSLCIEEQFYLFLPPIVLLIASKGNVRIGWGVVAGMLITGVFLRGGLWLSFIQNAGESTDKIYMTKIYYPSYCRLDGLVLGLAIAMLRNFHDSLWTRISNKGNWLTILGVIGCCFTFQELETAFGFYPTVFGYLLRSASFAALVLAALSPNSLLCRTKIPGATLLATGSYAIYLTHKQLIHLTHVLLTNYAINDTGLTAVILSIMASLVGGWLLYICIEKPFLKLRDKTPSVENLRLTATPSSW